MKKIIFLLAMTTFLFSDFAMQAQTKKRTTGKKKSSQGMHEDAQQNGSRTTKYDRLPRRSKST